MLRRLRTAVTVNPWRYALPAGLLTGLYVLLATEQFGTYDHTVVLLAGFVGGLLVGHDSGQARRVGFLTGVVSSFPTLLWALDTVPAFFQWPQPQWFAGVQTLVLVAVVVLAALIVGLAGAVGGAVGSWLSRKTGPNEPRRIGG
ncbi:DUF5518 domain-containing protein [Halomarina oriensis]|uniref:DUF5518 domain-containing protein n=1 Tax=Halomarina oriensis TaxID=671145 RepID=A0A6B0GQG5_9EURY|nr:DUF5518 domain-containing protein [Halomarina oriensis]MWG35829.1 hypothetical protein [Halomarina oriensis]